MKAKTKRKKRVLVVDDDPKILRFIHINLTVRGFDVLTAGSGEAALEKIRIQEPDIVVLDVLMPARDGISVLKELRTKWDIPVIMHSANASVTKYALECGADDFLKKPYKPDELAKRIGFLLEGGQN